MVPTRTCLSPISAARGGQKLRAFRGVTIHNTGNPGAGAGADNHAAYLQGSGQHKTASWHYAVDDKAITQSIPEDEVAWHAGDGNGDGNRATVAIEICINPESDLARATDNTAELAADILRRHGMTTAAGHLFQHHDWSGKNCPAQLRAGQPYSWDAFVAKVQQHLSGATPAPAPVPQQGMLSNPTYSGSSIADALAQIGIDNSCANRARLATANGIANYTGTAAQNTRMLDLLRAGQLRPAGSVAPEPAPQPACPYAPGDYRVTASPNLRVRSGPGTNHSVKPLSALTTSARRQGGYRTGVVFTAQEIRQGETGGWWARTPSGWVCLENAGGVYACRA
nr:N-acetylmuramoyl-L-alanine amidase [Maliibacterium massiliense]